MAVSLSDISGYSSVSNIRKSSSRLAATIANIASGKRFSQASADIASLAVATGLQSQLSGLRSASSNIFQAASMLQVADGGIGQIGDMLQRMQALSVQANSGALSQSAREGLNTEFQNLSQEINRISGNTNFNSVNLLNGSISANTLQTNTNIADKATGGVNFTANIAAGQTINLNGVTLTAGTDFNVGATQQDTIDNLATALNQSNNPALSGFSFKRTGATTLDITAKSAGEEGNQFTINRGSSTAAFNVNGSLITGPGQVYTLQGGTNDGLGTNSVQANGISGDNLITPQSQNAAQSTISFNSAADIAAGNTIQIDDGNGGFATFTFVNGAPANNTQIQIGNTLEETLQNAATTLENYSGSNDYGTRQLDFSTNGNQLLIKSETPGNALDVTGAALNINLTTVGGTLSNNTLNNGTNGGVDVSNVNNAAFVGKVQGFEADYTNPNQVQLSVKVGNETYTASVSNTNSGANQSVRFTSQNGGFFDVQLAGGNGQNVNNQSDADNFAARLDTAFSTLNFTQDRQVSNYQGRGTLVNSSLSVQGSNFSNLKLDSINVTPTPLGGSTSAIVEIKVNGETFRSSSGLGSKIGAGETVSFTSLTNPNNKLTFTNGNNQVDLSSQIGADQFKQDLQSSFGNTGTGLQLQVGEDADDVLNLNIPSLNTNALFGGKTLDLLSFSGSANSFNVIGAAIDNLVSARAQVGAFQEALNYTSANLESAIQNQEAARATLEDTDIASESLQNAIAAVQQQAAIATLAQTNRLRPSVLDLLKG